MPSNYPSALDSFVNPTTSDSLGSSGKEHTVQHEQVNTAVNKIESELGVNPKGSATSVAARLSNIEASITTAASTVSGASGTARNYTMQTLGVNRWRLTTNETAESGTATGSDFEIRAFNNDQTYPAAGTTTGVLTGSSLGAVLRITRSNGAVALGGALSVAGATTLAGTTVSGNLSLGGGATLASSQTLTNNGTISGGTINATTLQQGGVGVVLNNTATYSLSTSGNAATATLATKANTLANGGANGTAMTFTYSGVATQPTWLWGTSDGGNNSVFQSGNLSVASATNATNATNATYATYATTIYNQLTGLYKPVIAGQKSINPGALAPGIGTSIAFTETNGYYVTLTQASLPSGSQWFKFAVNTVSGNNYLYAYNCHPTDTLNIGTVTVNYLGIKS